MKKNKIFRKAMSVLLSLAILVGTVSICLPYLKLNVGAAGTITATYDDGTTETITQTQIVTSDRDLIYSNYASNYLNGAGESTGIVIPGLQNSENYVIQGMAYYPQKDWMLVTAYHSAGEKSSKVFCLDAATGEFEAMFSFVNEDDSVNKDHGGGIAISENNLYYSASDTDRYIAYVSLERLEELGKAEDGKKPYKAIKLEGRAEFTEIGSYEYDGKTAYTAYVCYDQGYLWMGNFYDVGAKLLGMDIAANGYNAPATKEANSMVYGYKLQGSNSAEEWDYLTNTMEHESDCVGSPTHAIALENNIKDVQYAVVDNGKLYLSCSYGSGAGLSVSFGFGETSKLITADIDLSAQPTKSVNISTSNGTKTINAHEINDYKSYDMMPMSEGLCVVNGLIFCTFESASKKYREDGGGGTISIGNCEKIVDVIWKINPYALENRVEIVDTPATHYEKVNSLSEIEKGEEYIIVYESPVKDPVTQKNILYAIDANGGYKDYRLSKSTFGSGYVGAIGHPITEYSIEGGKLYLGNAEKDDVKNIRWELTNLTATPTDGNDSFSIQSPDYYFVNHPNFYFDASTISMATDAVRKTKIMLHDSGDDEGGFWISHKDESDNEYFLWCNDGTTESYNSAYNNYYDANSDKVAMYSDVDEQAGTFHTDALNKSGSSVLGGEGVVKTDHRIFNIYKRVYDKTSSTYESRVYTNMNALLQADGTYTIDLETYAISPNHYEYVGDRPTDYIIVMDKSKSVSHIKEDTDCDGNVTGYSGGTLDGTALRAWDGELGIASLSYDQATNDDHGEGVCGYAFSKPEEQIYMKHSDGNYYRVYLAAKTTHYKSGVVGIGAEFKQLYWAYYIADDGLYYILKSNGEYGTTGETFEGITRKEFYDNIDKANASTSDSHEAVEALKVSGYSTAVNNTDRRKTKIYTGPHYTYTCSDLNDMNVTTRIETIKVKASELVEEIAALGSDNRIAVTYYGASSSFLAKNNSWATSGFENAFWPTDTTSVATIQSQINSISNYEPNAQTDSVELDFATQIMNNSGHKYSADGDRNCVIIFMSDGVPGADGGSNPTSAANNVIAKAKDAKDAGAFVFSVIVGKDPSSFDRKTYMDAVSSKYPAAINMTTLGGANVDGAEYTMNVGDITYERFEDLAPILGNEFVKNKAVGIANLNDENSFIYEEINSAFKPIIDETTGNFKDGIGVTWSLVPGDFDKVDRFTFDEDNKAVNPTTISVTPDANKNTRKIKISGYNYAEQYISKGKQGNKLRIRITGVLADEAADITNTSINNKDTTAIYRNSGVFKYFPTEYFNIPTYTYVLDYDLPMYDEDINGTLLSVDGALKRQDPNNYSKSRVTGNVALNFENSDLDMTYELVSLGYTEENNRSFCLIERDDGTYDWFRINIVPASNVLFEENRFATSTAGSEFNKSSWATVKAEDYESAEHQSLSGDNDRYGYDENYANNGNNYSNGTAYKTTVNSTKKRSDTMTFSYTGTGFDLMAACGANTGVQLVNIKKADGTIEKVFMVDTYYVDTENYDGALLNQVPIVSYKNEDGHGDYTVEVTAAYLSNAQGVTSGRAGMLNKAYTAQNLLKDMGINMPLSEVELVWFNDNSILNGGTGPVAEDSSANRGTAAAADVALDCYIDSIRVYNPLGSDSSHYINSEKGATYYNIVNELDPKEDGSSNGNIITGEVDENGNPKRLFAYVVGDLKADGDGKIPVLSFDNYQSVGPQNEIYLQPATNGEDSHAVAFNVAVPNSYSRVMISLRAVNGATTAMVASGGNSIKFEINTATEQYFDITPYLDINTTTGVANVIITNITNNDENSTSENSTSLLSVNNLKLVDATAQAVTSEDLPVMARSLSLRPTRVDPNSYDYDGVSDDIVIDNTQQPEVDTPVDDNTDVEVPVVVENIFTRIVAFFKKLFGFIFSI